MGRQRAVAGGCTSKYGGGTGKATHAIMSSSLTQVLHLFQRHHAPDAHTTNFHNTAISRFHIVSLNISLFWFISSHFFQLMFPFRAGWPNFFLASLNYDHEQSIVA